VQNPTLARHGFPARERLTVDVDILSTPTRRKHATQNNQQDNTLAYTTVATAAEQSAWLTLTGGMAVRHRHTHTRALRAAGALARSHGTARPSPVNYLFFDRRIEAQSYSSTGTGRRQKENKLEKHSTDVHN